MSEESHGRKYVNLSDRPFSHKIYDETRSGLGYKPKSAFWCSLESNNDEFVSTWDELYGEVTEPDEKGNLYVTTVEIKPTTYVFNPTEDEVLLEGFQNFVENHKGKLTAPEKRKLFLELLKKKQNNPDIEHVICQIDLPQDIEVIERIFAGYDPDKYNPDEVYENMMDNVRGAFVEVFSGVEVTDYALGNDEISEFEGNVYFFEGMKRRNDPKYSADFGFWEVHSLAIFDTNCLDIIDERVINQNERFKDLDDDDAR